MRASLLLLALLAVPQAVWAACPAPYSTDTLLDDLVMVETALRNNDGSTAGSVAGKIESGLPCMNEVMPFMVVSRVYRSIGAGYVAGGIEERGKSWFLTALEVDPVFEYGVEDLPAASPIRRAFEELRPDAEIPPVDIAGSTLVVGGKHFLDGSINAKPRATADRPHLYQHQTESGVSSWLIEGNGFPASQLAAAVVAVAPVPTGKPPKPEKAPKPPKPEKAPKPEKPPKPEPVVAEPEPVVAEPEPEPVVAEPEPVVAEPEPAPKPKPVKPRPEPEPEPVAAEPEPAPKPVKPRPEPEPEPAVVEVEPEPEPAPKVKPEKAPKPTKAPKPAPSGGGFVQRARPPEKTPLMIAGGTVILGSGALYALAWQSRSQFNKSGVQDPVGDDKGIEAYRKKTNNLVLLSGVVFLVGAGSLGWGIIVDDQGTAIPAIRGRF